MVTTDTAGFLRHLTGGRPEWFYHDTWWWTAIGLVGNLLFGSRFFIQWFQSERHKRIVVPPIFWHLSFWGSIVSLIYGLHIDKLPVILGCVFLPFLYARNLKLLRRTGSSSVNSDNAGETAASSGSPLPKN